MRIIIVGGGGVGSTLAEKLLKEKQDVVLIEKDKDRIREISGRFDVLPIEGNGASPIVLENAGIDESDMLIAVSNNDEANILSCILAAKAGVKYTVARISSPDYFHPDTGFSKEQMNIDLVIHPEQLCASEIFKLIRTPEAFELVEFDQGRAQLLGFRIDETSPLVNKRLAEFPTGSAISSIRFVGIARKGQIIIPHGEDALLDGDEVYLMGGVDSIPSFLVWAGIQSFVLKDVIIAGGGKVGVMLAQILEREEVETRLIEVDKKKAGDVSSLLKKTLVLAGNCTDRELLKEAGIDTADAFVGATDDDETNILSCVLAKKLGIKKTSALIQKVEYVDLVTSTIRIDAAFSTRLSTVNAVLHFVRGGKILSATALRNLDAETLEMVVTPGSKAAGKAIKQIKFPRNSVIGIISRDGRVLPATGDTVIQPNDRIVVFTLPSAIADVKKFFTK